ncbi:MAG: respiratory nitrate reductase subunit gamma [Anaerolineales bacterium]
MDWNTLLFMVFPYVSIILAIAVTGYRSLYRPFTISSLSSQLLERRKLYWGSISFHWGIVIILLCHLWALLFPKGLMLWNSVPIRLYLLELTGYGLGVWALVGLLILIWRRLSEARIRAVSTWMDYLVLALLLVSVVTGVITATGYRFGSYWFTAIFAPYLASIFTLRPQPALVASLPWVIQLHALNFFLLLVVFPFSRLVHIITYPLGYLIRPWQIVVRGRKMRPAEGENI